MEKVTASPSRDDCTIASARWTARVAVSADTSDDFIAILGSVSNGEHDLLADIAVRFA